MDADANNDDNNESVPDPDLSFFEMWELDGDTNTFFIQNRALHIKYNWEKWLLRENICKYNKSI